MTTNCDTRQTVSESIASVSEGAAKDGGPHVAGSNEEHGGGNTSPSTEEESIPTASSGGKNVATVHIAKGVQRYARTKEQRQLAKGGKAGHPGRFQGAMLEFLESKLPEYQRLPNVGEQGRCAMLNTFWESVIDSGFWQEFDLEAARATFKEESMMSDDEIIASLNASIKSWFRRKTTDTRTSSLATAMAASLKEFRKPVDGEPRRLTSWQMFMSKNVELIDELVQKEKVLAENQGRANIALRTAIAKRLLAEADEDVKSRIVEEIDADFQRKKELNDHLQVAEPSDPILQANARQMLARVVTPLIRAISEHTGLENITLLCGTAPKDTTNNYIVTAVHHGKTKEAVPRNFFQFDEEQFRLHVLPLFCRFLTATKGNAQHEGLPSNLDLSLTMPEEEPADPKSEMDLSDKPKVDRDVSKPATAIVERTCPQRELPQRASPTATSSQITKKGKEKEQPKARLRPGACPQLVRKLNAMSSEEREKEIERLNVLPEMEFGWENSDAKVAALIGSESDPEPEAEGERPCPRPRPRPVPRLAAGTSTSSPGVTAGGNGGVQPQLTPPTSTVVSPVITPATITPAATPTTIALPTTSTPVLPATTPATPATVTPSSALGEPESSILRDHVEADVSQSSLPDNLPPWIKQHADRLLKISMVEELKAIWAKIVHTWVRIEEKLGFATPRDGFMPAGRPAAITLWVQNARKKNVVIQAAGGEQFVEEWFHWWDSINPEWRARNSGRLVTGGEGEWDGMFKPGKCGFLLVLECLVGLREVAVIEDLTESMHDVSWVVGRVMAALETREDTADVSDAENIIDTNIHASSPKRKRSARGRRSTAGNDTVEDADEHNTPNAAAKRRKLNGRGRSRR